jgi:hypothetical protein
MRKLSALVFLAALAGSCGPMMGDGGGGSGGTGGGGSAGAGGGGGTGGTGGAGGGGATVPPDWVSGSRLRARVQTAPDGAKAFVGWYDSQLGINCTFGVATDGVERCLPDYSGATVSGYFSDMGCSTKLGQSTYPCATSPQPSYATALVQLSTCSALDGYNDPYQRRVFSISGAYAGTLYAGTPGSCNPVTSPPAGYVFYTLGAEVSSSTFAQGAIVTE